MTSNPYISTLIITSFLIFSSSSINATEYDIGWWCDKTPYPQPCNYFLSQTNQTFSSSQESDFRKLEIQLAIQRARTTYTDYVNLGSKCRNEKEKAAWTDCLDLYQQTIFHLNHTLESTVDFDTQTWLSTALTNLETCDAGFIELQVADFLLPLMYNNVSKLISNALAVSCGASKVVPQTYKHGFPTWVTRADRKLLQSSSSAANLVVAQDGSGDYTSIQAAINAAAKKRGSGRFVIRIKSGVYREKVEIANNLENIMLHGDGLRNTFISGSRSIGGGFTTFNSATVDGETEQALTYEFPAVTGEGFIARGITFRNTAGPQNYQAVAFRSGSDLSVFYRCGFEGYQDTLYVHSQRQFYKECDIYGTVDFIFGNAAVVLQSCNIYARKPIDKQKISITAQGRTDPNQNTGISIQNSRVMAASDLKPVLSSFKTYLGRPWKEYSRSVFLETYLDSLVDPAGWLEWDGNFALDTLYYGEYRNMGPGASTSGRVKWPGYRAITSANEASEFTVANFIAGGSWLPKTGVPFTSGL